MAGKMASFRQDKLSPDYVLIVADAEQVIN